jgi:Right handed beta helix region
MRKIALLIAVLGATVLLQLYAVPAYAVSSARTFVSRAGNDSNPCSESSPCLTFGGALAQTSDGGEIDCLDAGDYTSSFHIMISVTIDCHGTNAIVWNFNTGDGIDIDAPGQTVVLRGIDIVPAFSGGSSIGVNIAAAAAVYIEDCVVTGFIRGINDVRTTGLTQLFIKNTVVRNNHFDTNSPGIVLAAAPKNAVVLENVQSLGNGYGIAVATGNNVVISRSVMSGNGIAGIEADPGAQVFVDNTEISHNGSYGVEAFGTVALANSDISFNSSSIFGSTVSYGNNRLFGNGGGAAPTPVGGASTDFGQQ